MRMYKTSWLRPEIQKVEVLRKTEASVWPKEEDGRKSRRRSKRGEVNNYFDTWEKAHSYLMEEVQRKINGLRDQFAWEENRLSKIAEMGGKPMMDDIVANEIKEFAIKRLQEAYGFCGCAENAEFAMLNSNDGKDVDIHITLKLVKV